MSTGCREISKGAVHGTKVYSARVGPKGPALERFPDIKGLFDKRFGGNGKGKLL